MDPTETTRRQMTAEINAEAASRAALEAKHGEVLDTAQVQEKYEVLGFAAPCVIVRRRTDGKRGTLFFQHSPRFFFLFQEG